MLAAFLPECVALQAITPLTEKPVVTLEDVKSLK